MATLARAATAVLVITALAVLVQCARNPGPDEPETAVPAVAAPDGITRAAVEIEGWGLDGEPLVFVGDALFELINGGAELYHRHGFVHALSAQYADGDARSIALEVFEMTDAEGARAIFTDTAGHSGEALAIGDDAVLDSYYLNFRTGPYLVTVTGFESDEPTTDGIVALARAVAAALGGGR